MRAWLADQLLGLALRLDFHGALETMAYLVRAEGEQ